jgi:hypothetical protein
LIALVFILACCSSCLLFFVGCSSFYQFRGFHERIKNVNIDVFRSLRGEEEADGGATIDVSYFHQALSKQLQASAEHDDFVAFHWEVARLCLTLPLVLHNRAKVVASVMIWLKRSDAFSREMIIRLIPELARDLQHVFFESFQIVVEGLVELLDPMNVEAMEEILTCLAFLLKLMRRSLVEKLEDVFGFYRVLILHSKPYVRDFASQSFAFLLRKLAPARLNAFLESLCTLLGDSNASHHAVPGLASLFFHVMRGFGGRLHSQAPSFFSSVLESWDKLSSSVIQQRFGAVLESAVAECRAHVRKSAPGDLEFVYMELTKRLALPKLWQVPYLLRILRDCLSVFRKCPSFFSASKFLALCVSGGSSEQGELAAVLLMLLKKKDNERSVAEAAAKEVLRLNGEVLADSAKKIALMSTECHDGVLEILASDLAKNWSAGLNLISCLEFYTSIQHLSSFWASSKVQNVIRSLCGKSFAKESSETAVVEAGLALCGVACRSNTGLVSVVLNLVLGLEKRLLLQSPSRVEETCKTWMVIQLCGVSRLDECVRQVQSSTSATASSALAFCLSRNTALVTEDLWVVLFPLMCKNVTNRNHVLRHSALQVLGAFATLRPSCALLARVHAIQTMDYMRNEQAQHLIQIEIERAVAAVPIKNQEEVSVSVAALLGCSFVRFAPVGRGALIAMTRFLKNAEAWKTINEFLAVLLRDMLAKDVEVDETEGSLSLLEPTSHRKVWHACLSAIMSHPAEAEQSSRFLSPLFVSFYGKKGEHCDEDVLVSWLKVFAGFSNLRSVSQVEELRRISEALLSSTVESIQSEALTIVTKMDKKLVPFAPLLIAVVKSRTPKALGEALDQIQIDSVQEPSLRARLVSLCTRIVFPKSGHRGMSKKAFAFMGKFELGELDAFVGLLFPVSSQASVSETRIAIETLSVWQTRAAPYANVYLRVVEKALANRDTVNMGVKLLDRMLTEIPAECVISESLLGVLVEASRIPFVNLARDCQEGGPNVWLGFLGIVCKMHVLDELLERSGAVHAVLECLKIDNASIPATDAKLAALQMVANLIPNENEPLVAARFLKVLFPLMDMLLDFLESAVLGQENHLFKGSRRDFVALQLSILSRLVVLLERGHARRLIDIILPTVVASVQAGTVGAAGEDAGLDEVREKEAEFVHALDLVDGLVANLTPDLCSGLMQEILSLLLVVGHWRVLCVRLCMLLEHFVEVHFPEVVPAVLGLVNMMAFSQVVVGEVDVNRRLMGLEKASQLVAEMSETAVIQESPQFLVVLYSVVFLSSSNDMAIRDQATANVISLVQLAYRVHAGASDPPCVDAVVMPWIRKQLSVGSRAVLQSLLTILRQCVKEAPHHFPDWALLVGNEDPPKDFFTMAFDTSAAVRAEALKLLRRVLRNRSFELATVTEYLVPMVKHCLFDLTAGVGDRDAVKSYRDALVMVMQSLAQLLPWDYWTWTCNEFGAKWEDALAIRRGERVAMHLFCSLVDSFHFGKEDAVVDHAFLETQVIVRLQSNILEAQNQQALRNRKTKKLKDAAKGSRINVEVVVVLVRVLQKLPESLMSKFLSGVLRSVCNSLAEQDESIRDATRKTLAKISVALGPKLVSHFFFFFFFLFIEKTKNKIFWSSYYWNARSSCSWF